MTDFFCSLASTNLMHSCSQFRFIVVTLMRLTCEGKGCKGEGWRRIMCAGFAPFREVVPDRVGQRQRKPVPSLRDSFRLFMLTPHLRAGLLYAVPAGLQCGGSVRAFFRDFYFVGAIEIQVWATVVGRVKQQVPHRAFGPIRNDIPLPSARFGMTSLCFEPCSE